MLGTIFVPYTPANGRKMASSMRLEERTARGALFLSPPVAGYTFDPRVVAAEAVLASGKHLPLRVEHFPKLHVTFVAQRDRLSRHVRTVVLRDARGSIVGRERVRRY